MRPNNCSWHKAALSHAALWRTNVSISTASTNRHVSSRLSRLTHRSRSCGERNPGPQLINGFLVLESKPQTASRLLQPFSQNSLMWPTDGQTDRQRDRRRKHRKQSAASFATHAMRLNNNSKAIVDIRLRPRCCTPLSHFEYIPCSRRLYANTGRTWHKKLLWFTELYSVARRWAVYCDSPPGCLCVCMCVCPSASISPIY